MSQSARDTRVQQFQQALQERILIIDGAMGTMIQRHKLEEADYRGERFADWPRDVKGNNDLLVLSNPGIIAGIHDAYCAAGADILETNSFNGTQVSMADYGMESLVTELNREAAALARRVADEWTAREPHKPRFVAGVLGPTSRTCSISPDVNDPSFRNVGFDELVANTEDIADWIVAQGWPAGNVSCIPNFAAAPPIKTDKGWLLLYHGMNPGYGHGYNVGAMLLDLNDPIHARAIGMLRG